VQCQCLNLAINGLSSNHPLVLVLVKGSSTLDCQCTGTLGLLVLASTGNPLGPGPGPPALTGSEISLQVASSTTTKLELVVLGVVVKFKA